MTTRKWNWERHNKRQRINQHGALSIKDEAEYRQQDRAAKWLTKVEASIKHRKKPTKR